MERKEIFFHLCKQSGDTGEEMHEDQKGRGETFAIKIFV